MHYQCCNSFAVLPYTDCGERMCMLLKILGENAQMAFRLKICFVVELEKRHHFCREHLSFKTSKTGRKFSTKRILYRLCFCASPHGSSNCNIAVAAEITT